MMIFPTSWETAVFRFPSLGVTRLHRLAATAASSGSNDPQAWAD